MLIYKFKIHKLNGKQRGPSRSGKRDRIEP